MIIYSLSRYINSYCPLFYQSILLYESSFVLSLITSFISSLVLLFIIIYFTDG
jgi:hypothetical protein